MVLSNSSEAANICIDDNISKAKRLTNIPDQIINRFLFQTQKFKATSFYAWRVKI